MKFDLWTMFLHYRKSVNLQNNTWCTIAKTRRGVSIAGLADGAEPPGMHTSKYLFGNFLDSKAMNGVVSPAAQPKKFSYTYCNKG